MSLGASLSLWFNPFNIKDRCIKTSLINLSLPFKRTGGIPYICGTGGFVYCSAITELINARNSLYTVFLTFISSN